MLGDGFFYPERFVFIKPVQLPHSFALDGDQPARPLGDRRHGFFHDRFQFFDYQHLFHLAKELSNQFLGKGIGEA